MPSNLINQRFTRWVVVSKAVSKYGNVMWNCQCDCGNIREVSARSLLDGKSTSCGCLRKENQITHGMSNTPTYNSWDGMIARCYRESNPDYENYGGRGISVQESWKKFDNFLKDMGPRPDGKTLERNDVNGNYTKDNCVWITNDAQQLNKRNNVIVEYQGKNIPVSEAARRAGLNVQTVFQRLYAGKSGDALFLPARSKK